MSDPNTANTYRAPGGRRIRAIHELQRRLERRATALTLTLMAALCAIQPATAEEISRYKLDLLRGSSARRFKLALETLVKLPTGDEAELSSSGSADFGAQLLMTRYYEKACLHTSFGLLYLGEWDELGTPTQVLPSLMAAYERAFGAKSSGLAQLTVSESPFRDLQLSELAETSIQVTLGFKRVLRNRQVLFIGFTENIQNLNNTADVGFHVGLTQTFDPR